MLLSTIERVSVESLSVSILDSICNAKAVRALAAATLLSNDIFPENKTQSVAAIPLSMVGDITQLGNSDAHKGNVKKAAAIYLRDVLLNLNAMKNSFLFIGLTAKNVLP